MALKAYGAWLGGLALSFTSLLMGVVNSGCNYATTLYVSL